MLSIFALAATLVSAPLAQADTPDMGSATPKPVQTKALQVGFARSLAVEIRVAAPGGVTVTSAELTGGDWDERPFPGSDIHIGSVVTYTIGNDDPHGVLGGTMAFSVPYYSDRFSIEFEWTDGSPATCTVDPAGFQLITVNVEVLRAPDEASCIVAVSAR